MAVRKTSDSYDTQTKVKYDLPTYSKDSKMNNYSLFYDTDNNNKPRCGFYNKVSFDDSTMENMSIFEVTIEYEHRLDLIALKFFGTTTRTWILEDINDIEDPIEDIVVGKILRIPSEIEVLGMIS